MTEYVSETLHSFVERRARGGCEYCRLPQASRIFQFPVDHVIAIKHGGETTVSNLALACLSCNLHKGSDIASIDPMTGKLTPLYNPRKQKVGRSL